MWIRVFSFQKYHDTVIQDSNILILLQDLVEIIMVLQRSLAAAGRPVNLSEGSTVSSLLCQYASLLAAQGALNTAVSYLNSATQVGNGVVTEDILSVVFVL